ncbi:hypothetical protein SADUNF_Sadunf04G0065200 [Salix dunnii]|uniref:Uncharacterized protein n=1 Tax=Salix dunnii TaxID=1413687 RepID=A0A835N2R0_9ROSI|nr:hypothetical protein SADUNF_Sadunf04G0065200 [Salix dunnii]
MIKPPLEQYEIVDEVIEIDLVPVDPNKPLLVEAELPGIEEMETEHSKTPFSPRIFNSVSGTSETNFPDLETIEEGRVEGGESSSKPIWRCLAEPRVDRKIRVVAEQTPIHHILQPPTVASFLSIVIGAIPSFKHMVYGAHAPLEGPNESKLGIRTEIDIIVARLLVFPVIGIGVIYLADKWDLLIAGDRLYQFVLLLQYTTPCAILLRVIASMRGYAVKEALALLFWQHVCAMFIFMDHRLGVVKEFKLSIYRENDDVESAIGNGKASDDAKKHQQFLKMQLRSLQTTTDRILLIMDSFAFLCFKYDGLRA